MKIGEILKQMYFRRKPNKNCGTSAKPVSVSVTFGQLRISRTAEIK